MPRNSLTEAIMQKMTMPIIVAPMFLVSSAEMTVAACKAGAIGTCLASNSRTIDALATAFKYVIDHLDDHAAHWAAAMIVHKSYARFDEELELLQQFQPPIVITALGNPKRVIPTVHSYAGVVFCDVVSTEQARKAADSGVDGLIALCAGAGGHTGAYSSFALIEEIRSFWSGPLAIGGAVGTARGIRAAIELGADFAYMGTRFIGAEESMASDALRAMTIDAEMKDIVLSCASSDDLGQLAVFVSGSSVWSGFQFRQRVCGVASVDAGWSVA